MNKKTLDAIKFLGLEAIAEANSGHPGIVLSAAPIMYALFRDHLRFNPDKPKFINRDRFVMSAGHGSALLYSTMVVSGCGRIEMNDLKNFRQLGSKTAGHPESHLLSGIDASTGPLGQGVAHAVGLAIAETHLAALWNKGAKFIDHHTYCLFGDGCFQEGIFNESVSIAGRYGLNKLIMLYDSNDMQLDGPVSSSTKVDVKKYFTSQNWNYIKVANGSDPKAITEAIAQAKTSKRKPTIIEVKTILGNGSSKAGSNAAHGSPISFEEIEKMKTEANYTNAKFTIDIAISNDFLLRPVRTREMKSKFEDAANQLSETQPRIYERIKDVLGSKGFEIEEKHFKSVKQVDKIATRDLAGQCIAAITKINKEFMILNPDLSGSTKVAAYGPKYQDRKYRFQNVDLGVRELAMAAINNGIMSHGGLLAAGATFFSFANYCLPAMRVAAISQMPVLHFFSHDSINVGEDGPTHQPIEQLWQLRLLPNHYLFRPANRAEMIAAIANYVNDKKMTSIITSRLPFKQHNAKISEAQKGGYIISKESGIKLTIVATGAEVALAMEVKELIKEKIAVNVVSMPCYELFKEQDETYKEHVLGKKPIAVIEYGIKQPWYEIADDVYGMSEFGVSGKPDDVIKHFKLDALSIAESLLEKYGPKGEIIKETEELAKAAEKK